MKLRTVSLGLGLCLAALLPGWAQLPVPVSSYVLQLQPGWNAIANPLDVGANRVSELFPNLPEGVMLAKFNASSMSFELNQVDPGGVWVIDGGFAGTLRPGEGAFLLLPAGLPPMQLTIGGQPHEPFPLVDAQPGFNLVGCQSLEPCSFEELMGFSPQPGDAVYFYDAPAGPQNPPPGPALATRVSRFGPNGWDVVPVIERARGVYVELGNRPRLAIVPPRLRVAVGATAQFTAMSVGGQPTAFRWRFNGTLLSNAFARTLTLSNAQPAVAGNYVVEAMFPTGPVTSLVARLSVLFPPVITNQPPSITVVEGATALFKVGVAGSSPFAYQWFRNGAAIAPPQGADSVLTITSAKASDAGNYFVIVSNFVGRATSVVAVLNVLTPPRILIQPVGQVVNAGGTVTLSVFADGTPPLMFQWLLNGNIIPGANGPTLTITNFQPEQAGSYRVIVSNPAGAVQSQVAEVQLNLVVTSLSDFFANAFTLSGIQGVIRGSNGAGTLEPNEPAHAGHPGGRSVWVNYRTANLPGIVTFHTRGSGFDTLLAAYVGSGVGNLVEVGSDDDRGDFLTSEITFNVQTNVVYHVVVDGLDGESGDILLQWRFQPTIEQFPAITNQPKSRSVMEGQPVAFTVQALGSNLRYQWFFDGRLITNATSDMLILTNVQVRDVGAYTVQVINGLQTNWSRPAELDLREVDGPGQPQVKAYDKLQDLVAALAGRPPDFQPASAVFGYTGSQTFSTIGSGGQNGEPVHCGASGGHSKWYSYITPTNGTLFINTDGSTFDTLLAVYSGCCLFSTLTPVACDNNGGTNGLTSAVSFPATANTLYFIAVDGVGGSSGTVKLNYRLLVPMMLTNLSSTTNSITFRFNVTPSWPFNIQRSSNCLDWVTLFTSNSSASPVMFMDTNLPAGRRFYRSMQAP